MKVIISILIICCLGLGSQRVYAYEPINHEQLSESAAKQSKLATDPSVLVDLGLKPYADVGQTFANSTGSLLAIEELIKFGARNEDSFARPANHFYNPLTGQGVSGFTSSPNWAIDGEGDTSTTKFSFRAAREYMFGALTDSSESFRLKQFGLMFQSLGQVIHHIQDMAAPQHVRDDKHCDAFFPCQIPGSLFGLHNLSHFEKWTLENVAIGPLLGALPVYAPVYGVGREAGDYCGWQSFPRMLEALDKVEAQFRAAGVVQGTVVSFFKSNDKALKEKGCGSIREVLA